MTWDTRVLECVSDGVEVFDADWRLTYLNPVARQVLVRQGIDPDAMLGKQLWTELVRESSDISAARYLKRAMSERVSVSFESHYSRWDGWDQVRVDPLPDGGIVVAFQDITKRKAAEAAHRESEERFRRVFDLGLVGMAITSPTRRISEVNDCLCDMFGYTRRELERMSWEEITHPDDLSKDLAHLRQVLRGHIDGYAMDKRFLRRDRTIVETRMSVRCVRRADWSVLYFIALVEDVTEYKRAERALRESDGRFRLVSEALSAFIYDWDAATDHVQRYGSMDAVLGFRPEEASPTMAWWTDRIHPDDLARTRTITRSAMEDGGDSYYIEYRVRHRDGHYVDLADGARIVRDGAGKVTRVVGGCRNISARVALERERQALLDSESAARSGAERAIRARDEVMSVVGHDLRTALSAIQVCASAVLQSPEASEATTRGMFKAIEQSAVASDRMIRDLLEVTLLEAGHLPLELRDEDATAIVALASEIFAPSARERGIEIEVVVPGEVPHVRADNARILQALGNLISNAIKFTSGPGRITVSAARDPAGVVFSVEDDGVGITADDLPHVFDRYWRKSKSGRSGSGLGLAIVRGIVESHGGHVMARSTPGQGSAFSFTLPCVPIVLSSQSHSMANGAGRE